MLGVKSLALGLLMTGTVVVPALAGSIRPVHHHVQQTRETLHPAPTSPLASDPIAAPMHRVGFENLAGPAAQVPASNPGFGFAQLGNQVVAAPTPYSSYASSSASAYTEPVAGSYNASPAASTTVAAPTPAYSPASSGDHAYAAFINFGSSGFSEAQTLTSGTPSAWYTSPVVQQVFGGTPTAAQQSGFISEVLHTAQQTYAMSGLNVNLTVDPTQDYAHTMSVVSGASYNANPNAIGITDVGNDGFSFIDKFGSAKNSDELAEAIGHNIAHELMHAFGIAQHPDQTGTYLDAATASWSILTNPNTMFSPQAAKLLSTMDFFSGPGKEFTQGVGGISGLELLTEHHPHFCTCPLCTALRKLKAAAAQAIGPDAAPVPEPTTLALWGLAGALAIAARTRAGRRRVPA